MKENDDAVLMWNGVPVLTTMMLSERIGIAEANIRKNYSKNKDRFKVDTDYFEIKGTDLKTLRKELHNLKLDRYQIDPKTPFLYLWTEKGAHNHAKIGETDGSWEAFLHLRNGYFRQKQALKALKEAIMPEPPPLLLHMTREHQIDNSKKVNDKNYKEGGVPMLTNYHIQTALDLSGKKPGYWMKLAKDNGLKSKFYNSGRESIRYYRPDIAASISVHDSMYYYGGKLEEITPLCKSIQPVFAKMIELGMLPKAS